MSTGSCFWKMQAFMQSLQMRWPVAATIGLSMAIDGERAERVALRRAACASREIFSSSGQPASVHAEAAIFWNAPRLAVAQRPCEQESLPCSWHQMQ